MVEELKLAFRALSDEDSEEEGVLPDPETESTEGNENTDEEEEEEGGGY